MNRRRMLRRLGPSAGRSSARHGRRSERDSGQIIVLFALVLVVILGFAAMVIDLGVLRNNRQILVNSLDASALAGGSMMPVDGSIPGATAAVEALIDQTMAANYPGIPKSGYQITYRCLIGVDASNLPDIARDIPPVCDPHWSLGHTPVASDFVGAGPTRSSPCNPKVGDRCNTVVVSGAATTPFSIGPVVGVPSGSTGPASSAACNGPCGKPPTGPVDIVLVMDRTSSMSGTDTVNAKAAANAILPVYNPANQWLALAALGPSRTGLPCAFAPDGSIGNVNMPADLRRWVPVGLSGTGSSFATTYAQVSAGITCYTNSSTGTDLADPVTAAAWELTHNGRAGAKMGIILETDGQPNAAVGSIANQAYCAAANTAATNAKALGIEIYTVGFGLDSTTVCPDTAGAFKSKLASTLLASMSGTSSGASVDNGCTAAENTDGDQFFCEPKSGDLSSVFKYVASSIAQTGAILVQLYPPPVVQGVSPSSGLAAGNNVIIVTGKYLSGATSVMFGGTPAISYTVTSDSAITVRVPAGVRGTTTDIVVTTGGGSSLQVTADQYTYT